jgi:hypothetical protein
MKASNFAFRMWYYFRVGYTTYLSFLLGFATTFVTVYYLAITNIPTLQALFPHFGLFAVVALVVGVPTACIIGWFHMKGSSLWKSEVDITVEANPYLYKMYPGYWIEAFTPLYLELLGGVKKILEKEGMLSEEERGRIEDLEKKLEILMKGGFVGVPKTRADMLS